MQRRELGRSGLHVWVLGLGIRSGTCLERARAVNVYFEPGKLAAMAALNR